MNTKAAAAAIAMAMVMMCVPAMAMLPSDDVLAASGDTYAVGLVEGTAYEYTPTFNLSNVTVTLSGTAASWLSVSGNKISGTAPAVSTSGTTASYDLVIKATTTQPTQEAYQNIQFTVYDTLTVSGSASTVNTFVGGTVNVTSSANYSSGVTFSATGLPAGVSINASTGKITGSPTAAGNTSATITASHLASGQTKTYSVAFKVSAEIAVSSGTDMYVVNGQEITVDPSHMDYYKLTSNLSGVTFELKSGDVTGITVNSDGTITGTPTSMGSIDIVITATETATGQSTDFELTMHIVSKLSFDSVPTGGIIVSGA